MLQWTLDEGTARKHTDVNMVKRIFLINFAAIHTSSTVSIRVAPQFCDVLTLGSAYQSMTHVLYDLAAMPEYIPALREEVESVVASDGWTKAAMAKMWKLDSVFRESSRYNGLGLSSCSVPRPT